MKILGIETSSPLFSLSISDDAQILYEVKVNRLIASSQDGYLFIEAKKILQQFAEDGIDAIAVDIGPGQFTSLRVGLSLAKGLALTRNIPLVGVNSLDIIGAAFSYLEKPIFVVLNAYRGEFYTARYYQGSIKGRYLLMNQDNLFQQLKKKPGWVVTNAGIEDYIKNIKGVKILPGNWAFPSSSQLIMLALSRIKNQKFDEPDFLEPFYMKRTDAERNFDKRDGIE